MALKSYRDTYQERTKQIHHDSLKLEFVKKIPFILFFMLVALSLYTPQEVSAASNPTSRVSWTADEIGTEAPNNRKLVRTSDGTLHAFISSLTVTNTCGGVSQVSGLIYVNSTDNGATWTCQSHLNTSANFQWATAVTDANDNIYLVYSGFDVIYRKLTKGSGATWTIGSEQTIITGAGSLLGAGGVLEREGTTRLWLALQYRASGTAISTRVYYSDGFGTAPTWTLSADLDTPDASSSNTHYPVIVRYGSNIGVLYSNYNGSTYDLNWRHRADSDGLTTWSTAETIVTTSSSNKHLSATVDNNNYIHLVYGSTGTNGSNVTVAYKYYNGTSWSSAVTLSGAANSGGHSPSITTNGTDIWVFWQGRHNTGLGSSTTIGRVVYRKGVSPFASGNFEAETVLNSADRAYDKIYTYIGGTYADKTTAGNDAPNDITLGASVGDITYFGHSEKYRAVTGLMATAGAGGVVVYEYWSGSAWTTLTTFGTRFPNFTNATIGGYEVDFIPPSDWAATVVDGTNAPGSYYYVRARVTTAYTTTPIAENFWAYPQTSAIQIPVKATGGILPIVWGETSPFATGDAIVQFNSLAINTNPSSPSSLGGHVSGSYTGNTTPTLTFTLSDPDVADTVKYQIQIDDTSDFSSPVVNYTSALASQGATSFTVGQAAGSGTYTTGSSGQTLSDGSYYWRVKAIDNSSAESSYATANSGSVAFIADSTAPSVPGTPSTTTPTNDTTPTWSWTASTDAGSGLAGTPYTLQWSQSATFASGVSSSTSSTNSFTHSTTLAAGTWYFRAKATDTVGNESAYSSGGTVVINTTAPTGSVQINLDASYINVSSATLTLSATDDTDAASALSMKISENSDLTGASYETYATSKSWTFASLIDGVKTIYTKFRDSLGNESSTYSDSITLDRTAPNSFDLQSPSNKEYSNNERPTFRWKAAGTGDALSGLSKYKLEIDNGETGDFTIDDIAVSRTSTLETNKYVIQYENFSDSDNANNYISVYTKSSSDWNTNQNDGKLKEGKRRWKVVAYDNAGNTREESRELFVDSTVPSIAITQINDLAFVSNVKTNDTTPTFFGKITDSLSGNSSSISEQVKKENKVVSGAKSASITIQKENSFGEFETYSTASVTISDNYYTSTGQKITDTSDNSDDKYSSFSYTPTDSLPFGTYLVVITGKDAAGNASSQITFNLIIGSLGSLLTTDKKEIIKQKTKTIHPEEKQKEELIITTETEPPSAEEKSLLAAVTTTLQKIVDSLRTFTGNITTYVVSIGSAGKEALSDGIQKPAQFTSRFGQWASYSLVTFNEIVLTKEPTSISDVRVEQVTATSALITWKTNHYATSKVNYGTTLDYGKSKQTTKKTREHSLEIIGLTPGIEYYYEVMSQGKNYVYDAYHVFTTLPKK